MLPQIVRISRRNLTEIYSDFIFIDIYHSWPSGFIVAMDSDKVAGFICGSVDEDREARVLILVVDEPYRRRGIGEKLMELFEEESKKIKIEKIRLEVKTSNKSAISLYKKLGYVISNMLPVYYNDGSDAYVMQKFI